MINIELITTSEQRNIAKRIVEQHHSYVPTFDSVGRRIDWLIRYGDNIVGMIGIGSSVYPPPKDLLTYLGLTKDEYKNIFNTICNNWRFCISQPIPNLGTQVLKLVRNDAPLEWKRKYGDTLTHIITFIGSDKTGAVYKADNWIYIGQTAGLPEHDSSSMKWNTAEELKTKFVKPTGENRKLIFVKKLNIDKSIQRNVLPPATAKFFDF